MTSAPDECHRKIIRRGGSSPGWSATTPTLHRANGRPKIALTLAQSGVKHSGLHQSLGTPRHPLRARSDQLDTDVKSWA